MGSCRCGSCFTWCRPEAVVILLCGEGSRVWTRDADGVGVRLPSDSSSAPPGDFADKKPAGDGLAGLMMMGAGAGAGSAAAQELGFVCWGGGPEAVGVPLWPEAGGAAAAPAAVTSGEVGMAAAT